MLLTMIEPCKVFWNSTSLPRRQVFLPQVKSAYHGGRIGNGVVGLVADDQFHRISGFSSADGKRSECGYRQGS